MAEEDYGIVPYRDLSELKSQLESMHGKKDISTKDLHDAVVKLSNTMSGMIDIFSAAAEQLKLEEKEKEIDAKKHDVTASKLDKLLDQNKVIAEGMLAVVEMVKERLGTDETSFKPREEPIFAPRDAIDSTKKPEPRFTRQEWEPRADAIPIPAIMPQSPPMAPMMQSSMNMPMPNIPPPPSSNMDSGMQSMEPAPMPDFDFLEGPNLGELEAPKKKGILRMFKK